jgi:hypothetical protein
MGTAEELIEHLVEGSAPVFDVWSRDTAAIWIRAGFKCEYCDRHMLERHELYRFAEVEHILPKSRFGEPNSDVGMALTCRYCNLLKRAEIVGDVVTHRRLMEGSVEARAALIAAYRERIRTKREDYDRKLVALHEMIRRILDA